MKAQAIPFGSPLERFTRRMFTRIITSLSQTLREEELSIAQVATLYLLDDRGRLRIGDVGAELDQGAPSVSRLVDDLVARGLVERAEDPSDRRARVLALTAKGRKLVERTSNVRVETISAAARDVPADFLAQVRQLLGL